jgi:hypothetical protein
VQITFNLPHVFSPASNPVENARVLRALLVCLIETNVAYLREHPETRSLYRSGVVYGRTTWWEPIPALYARGYGDCKSLAAALIAEYHMAGIPCSPVFRFVDFANGNKGYHILVQTGQGFEDPSKVLGMGKNENARF